MTTAADLIAETRNYLLAGHREQMNKLASAVNTTQTSISFVYDLGPLQEGAHLSVGLEIMYVWEADTASKTVVVQRGVNGSTISSHASDSIVTVNPKFPDFLILKAINNDILDLNGQGLFQPKVTQFTFVAGRYGYDLTNATAVLAGLDARYNPPGQARDWPTLNKWKIRRNSDTADFPSGFAVILKEDAYPGRPVRITYAAPYTVLTSLTDDVATVTGLQEVGHDIPALGAAFRLEAVREPQRNFNEAQPSTRRSAEVPMGAQITSTRGLIALREARIRSLKTQLNREYPNKRIIR